MIEAAFDRVLRVATYTIQYMLMRTEPTDHPVVFVAQKQSVNLVTLSLRVILIIRNMTFKQSNVDHHSPGCFCLPVLISTTLNVTESESDSPQCDT